MTPSFQNNNPHVIYVNLPSEAEPAKLKAFEIREATGADADALDATPGVVNLSTAPSDVKEQLSTTLSQRELLAGSSFQDPGSIPGVPGVAGAADGLDEKNMDELKDIARERELSGFSSLNKDELIEKLREAVFAPAPGDESTSDGSGTITSDQVPSSASTPPAPPAPKPLPDPPPKVGAGSGRDDWAKYAKANGIDYPDDAKRADLYKLVEKAQKARAGEIKAAEKAAAASDG